MSVKETTFADRYGAGTSRIQCKEPNRGTLPRSQPAQRILDAMYQQAREGFSQADYDEIERRTLAAIEAGKK